VSTRHRQGIKPSKSHVLTIFTKSYTALVFKDELHTTIHGKLFHLSLNAREHYKHLVNTTSITEMTSGNIVYAAAIISDMAMKKSVHKYCTAFCLKNAAFINRGYCPTWSHFFLTCTSYNRSLILANCLKQFPECRHI